MASNVFYEYFKSGQNGGHISSLSAWSPARHQYYSASCSTGNGVITCSISGASDPNAQVKFTQAALNAFSPQQAGSYASNHDVGPNG